MNYLLIRGCVPEREPAKKQPSQYTEETGDNTEIESVAKDNAGKTTQVE